MYDIKEKADQIIYELENIGFINRIGTYGISGYFSLILSKSVNGKLYNYLKNYLEEIDDVILKLKNENYYVRINRNELGEIYNVSMINSNKSMELFFKSVFEKINVYLVEILKATIDYCYDNNIIDVFKINSLNVFTNIKCNDILFNKVQILIKKYHPFMINMPNKFVYEILGMSNIYITNDLINSIFSDLEKKMLDYILNKNLSKKNYYLVGDRI